MYNAVNFNNNYGSYTNVTIAGVRLSVLTCPSDTANSPALLRTVSSDTTIPGWNFGVNNSPDQPPDSTYLQAYTSYGASMGTYPVSWQQSFLTSATGPAEFFQINGVIYNDSTINISTITDGSSNTFLFGEHARTNLMTYDPGFALSTASGTPVATTTPCFRPGIRQRGPGRRQRRSTAAIVSGAFIP